MQINVPNAPIPKIEPVDGTEPSDIQRIIGPEERIIWYGRPDPSWKRLFADLAFEVKLLAAVSLIVVFIAGGAGHELWFALLMSSIIPGVVSASLIGMRYTAARTAFALTSSDFIIVKPDLLRLRARPRAFRYAAALTPWLEHRGDEISFGKDRRAPVSLNGPHVPIHLCFHHLDDPDEVLAVMTRVRREALEGVVLEAMS